MEAPAMNVPQHFTKATPFRHAPRLQLKPQPRAASLFPAAVSANSFAECLAKNIIQLDVR